MENLEFIKNVLQCEANRLNTGMKYEVKEVFWDLGAGIKHVTIVVERSDGTGWQIFSPREIEEVNDGVYTNKQLMDLVNNHAERA